MSGSVTYCIECGACNWAGEPKCAVCGGELEPTLREVHAHYYNTDPDFRKMVDKNIEALGEKKNGGDKSK